MNQNWVATFARNKASVMASILLCLCCGALIGGCSVERGGGDPNTPAPAENLPPTDEATMPMLDEHGDPVFVFAGKLQAGETAGTYSPTEGRIFQIMSDGRRVELGDFTEIFCDMNGGCTSYQHPTDGGSNGLGTAKQGLELDGIVNPAVECLGNCAPPNLTWCGNATLGGQAYLSRWGCFVTFKDDGSCRMVGRAFPCDEGDECLLIGILPSVGICQEPQECNVDADCDDGAFCNGAEQCSAGFCEPGVPPVLSDDRSCTVDSCDEDTDSVVNTPVNGLCNDNLVCNGTETCAPAAPGADGTTGCVAGVPLVTDDGNACTVDSCAEPNGVVNNAAAANGANCDDTQACTVGDVCVNGECRGAESCDDGNECTADACDQNGDCAGTPVADGIACTDGLCIQGACEVDGCDPANFTRCANFGGESSFLACVPVQGSLFGISTLIEVCPLACIEPSPFSAGGCSCRGPAFPGDCNAGEACVDGLCQRPCGVGLPACPAGQACAGGICQ